MLEPHQDEKEFNDFTIEELKDEIEDLDSYVEQMVNNLEIERQIIMKECDYLLSHKNNGSGELPIGNMNNDVNRELLKQNKAI